MSKFLIQKNKTGFALHHNGQIIAEGLTRQEAGDVAGHLEKVLYPVGEQTRQRPPALFFPPALHHKAVKAAGKSAA